MWGVLAAWEATSWTPTSWTPLSPAGKAPKPRNGRTATYCPTDGGGAMYIFGCPGPGSCSSRQTAPGTEPRQRRPPGPRGKGRGSGRLGRRPTASRGESCPGLGAGGRRFGGTVCARTVNRFGAWSLARKRAMVAFLLSWRPLASGLPGWAVVECVRFLRNHLRPPPKHRVSLGYRSPRVLGCRQKFNILFLASLLS